MIVRIFTAPSSGAETTAYRSRLAIEALKREHGCDLDLKLLRRNLVTRGIDLAALIGREFRVGPEVVLRGRKAWPPCSHLVKLSGRTEIFQYLARDCGIGADIITGGVITLGDVVTMP